MKLSPPGSSSDLETARAIARRLSQPTPSREALGRPASPPPGRASAPPTWTEILQDCLFLARAGGALLINIQGQIAASCGDWPPPGVEAIAARLVPAMDKALKDAPTRSVSVPLSGKHLTAWRVPVEGGLLTVGFIAEAPLKPEVRPSIDGELKRGQA